jgi:hypothetical protein
MESKVELWKAMAGVMADVKNIDKSMTVGSGQNSYKGVSDKDVKLVIGQAMQKHGLIMIPKSYETNLTVDRWEEADKYNGGVKQKQSVFVEAKCVYTVIHVESGQSVDVPAYGHGIDSQDKAAGKATTYAMKYALLYSFLVPTGSIDDTDKDHGDAKLVPAPAKPAKPEFTSAQFEKAFNANATVEKIKQLYTLTPEVEEEWVEFVFKKAESNVTEK